MKQRNYYVVSKFFHLSDFPIIEEWLEQNATKGLVLEKIRGRKFLFSCVRPQKIRYFILETEIGQNSRYWLFSEVLQCGGREIRYEGLRPRMVCAIKEDDFIKNRICIDYCRRYRNHRILRRNICNSILSISGIIISSIICYLDPHSVDTMLLLLFASLLFAMYWLVSLIIFCHRCRKHDLSISWQRPARPGYDYWQGEKK